MRSVRLFCSCSRVESPGFRTPSTVLWNRILSLRKLNPCRCGKYLCLEEERAQHRHLQAASAGTQLKLDIQTPPAGAADAHMAVTRRRSGNNYVHAASAASHGHPETVHPPEGYCLVEADLHRATTSLEVCAYVLVCLYSASPRPERIACSFAPSVRSRRWGADWFLLTAVHVA